MTAQLSPLRTGRITASRVAPILGIGRYGSRTEVLREMVRAAFGAESEFTGNAATAHGQAHEEDARVAYERSTGRLVLDAQDFVIHPEHDWLGCSPDGLVDADGMAEFKCPPRAVYTSLAAQPHYAAQVQFQLACTGRAWCDFVIWRSPERAAYINADPLIIDRATADPSWLRKYLPKLQAFHEEYSAIVAEPVLAAPYLADLTPGDVWGGR